MTPLAIEILLHYHGHAYDYREGDFSAPAVRELIDRFRGDNPLYTDSGMLEIETQMGNRSYRLTDKGRVYVAALLSVPLPVQVWVLPKTKEPA